MSDIESKTQQLYNELVSVNTERNALETELKAGGWMKEQDLPIPGSIHQKLVHLIGLYTRENMLSRQMIALKKIQMDREEIEILARVTEISCS